MSRDSADGPSQRSSARLGGRAASTPPDPAPTSREATTRASPAEPAREGRAVGLRAEARRAAEALPEAAEEGRTRARRPRTPAAFRRRLQHLVSYTAAFRWGLGWAVFRTFPCPATARGFNITTPPATAVSRCIPRRKWAVAEG